MHFQRPGDYFRKIKHTNGEEIAEFVSKAFGIRREYFLGVRGEGVFDSGNRQFAALYIVKGIKRG